MSAAVTPAAPKPAISNEFSLHLLQYALPSNKVLLHEQLWWDYANQRTRGFFGPPEFPRSFTQIARFDIGKLYQLSGGVYDAEGSTDPVVCEVRNVTGTIPQFFQTPANASFLGPSIAFGAIEAMSSNKSETCPRTFELGAVFQVCSSFKARSSAKSSGRAVRLLQLLSL